MRPRRWLVGFALAGLLATGGCLDFVSPDIPPPGEEEAKDTEPEDGSESRQALPRPGGLN